jgi:pentatricopeptide repeat protein
MLRVGLRSTREWLSLVSATTSCHRFPVVARCCLSTINSTSSAHLVPNNININSDTKQATKSADAASNTSKTVAVSPTTSSLPSKSSSSLISATQDIRSLTQRGKLDAAIAIFQRLIDGTLIHSFQFMCHLCVCVCVCVCVWCALTEGEHLDEMVYNTLIGGYVNHARDAGYSRGRELYDLMQMKGCRPDHVTMSLLMKSAAKMKNLEHGRWVWNELQQRSMLPTVSLINHWIACHTMLRARQSLQLLELFNKFQLQPDLNTYHALLENALQAAIPNRHQKRAQFLLSLW